MPNAEVENNSLPAGQAGAFGIPTSALNKSENNNSALNTPHSDLKELQTENMEVHHHPEVEKKGFKAYILEGLMIFLAVFMGFVAENIREAVVEKKRETAYVKEMVNNLKYDTIRCNRNIASDQKDMLGLDTLRQELQKAINGTVNGNKLYYLFIQYTRTFGRAVFNSSAYTELKSSGSLRLIADKKLVTQMSDYYDRRVMAAISGQPSELRDQLKKTNNMFFSWAYFDDLIKASDNKDAGFKTVYNYQKILSAQPALKLLDTKPADLQRLYNETADFELGVKDYVFFLNWVKGAAVSLMSEINKQYDLENE
jgi:hypothetical protein